MKQFLPIILVIMLTGCTTATSTVSTTISESVLATAVIDAASPVITAVNPINFFTTGFYPLLIIAELETNFSSLVIDKTKAKVDKKVIKTIDILPENSSVFVMPTIIDVYDIKSYSEYYSGMIRNYLMLNSFAVPVANINDADYIIRIDISESPERSIGKNFANIKVMIMEANETPSFFTDIMIVSKSDRNFYYHPTKSALPVKELTLYGLEILFEDALPQAFAAHN